jgi:undecaprenyl-diphosphatase
MSLLEAILFGLIQGLTEFIPVSSSGHLLIAHEIFGTDDSSLAFDVALHVGTLFALFLYFRHDLIKLARNFYKSNKDGALARLLLVATLPAAFAGLLFSDFIDDNLRSPVIVAITLATVGVLMLFADKHSEKVHSSSAVTTKQGILIGFAQVAALIPGVSRSGATITAGFFLGLSRKQAARFSFLLAIPIIAGSAVGILLAGSNELAVGSWQLALGMIAAFVSGLLAIRVLLGIIERVGLRPFAYYRFAVAALVLIFLV